MRDLYEEILKYYSLNESLSKEPSSPITVSSDDEAKKMDEHSLNTYRNTDLTTYHNKTKENYINGREYKLENGKKEWHDDNQYHPGANGVVHEVSWHTNRPKNTMNNTERKNSLHDAMHLHNHFIKHEAEVGDVIKNTPANDNIDKKTTGNQRSRIYSKMAGFGERNDDNVQYGIIKQHPDNHPDESKRGQKYSHPLEHHEIEQHKDNVKKINSDNTIRFYTDYDDEDYDNESPRHHTLLNGYRHTLTDINGGGRRTPKYKQTVYSHVSNIDDHKPEDIQRVHNAAISKYTKAGDELIKINR